MAYPAVITADAPYIYIPFTGNALTNTGSKTGVTQTSAGIAYATGTGYTGISANFNTTSSHVQYTVGTDNVLGGSVWSAEAWIKKGTITTWANIIHREENPAGGREQFVLRVDAPGSTNAEKLTLSVVKAGVTTQLVGPFVDTNWHHVAVTSDGTTMRMYYDGVQVASAAAVAPVFTNSTFRLGAYGTGVGNENWVGQMDEVAIYKTTLSATRVKAHYDDGMNYFGRIITTTPATATSLMSNAAVTAEDRIHQTLIALDNGVTNGQDNGDASLGFGHNEGSRLLIKPSIAYAPVSGKGIATALLRINAEGGGSVYDGRQFVIKMVTQDWSGEFAPIYPTVTDEGMIQFSGWNAGARTFDITHFVNKWQNGTPNYGIQITALNPTGTLFSLAGIANADPALKPATLVTLGDMVPVTIQTTPMTAGASGVDASAFVGTLVDAGAFSGSATMPSGQFFSPDRFHAAAPMQAAAPNLFPTVIAGTSTVINAPAIELSAGMADAEYTNVTDRVFEVSPFTATFKWVVPYNPDDDRYLNYLPFTMDADDIWLKLEETSGTIAADSMTNAQGQVATTGTYRGAPVFAVEGPQLRKAVSFPTTADYLEINYPTDPTSINLFSNSEFTTEFSFKTTQLNGDFSDGARLVNGEFTFGDPGTNTYVRVRKFVADGEWHHIVVSTPGDQNPQGVLSDDRPSFVMIDGVTEYKRFGGGGVPVSLRAPKTLMRGINGSLRDFVFRINYAVSESTATKLYYEWSNANIVAAEAFTASAAMAQGSTAKGNQKRMLVLYGLSTATAQYADTGQSERGNYQSPFSGLRLRTRQGAAPGTRGDDGMIPLTNPFRSSFTGNIDYYFVHPFNYQGYSVYPVSIAGGFDGTGEVKSVPNIVSSEYKDRVTGNFVEDRTGLNRFIDLDRDLIGDVTEFDALTVFNYPAYAPANYGTVFGSDGVSPGSEYPFSQGNQLLATNSEWSNARDNLRDSVLRAWSRGVALWITEPDQAQHMGFIQAWDEHGFGEWLESPEEVAPMSNTNNAGHALDLAHGGNPGFVLGRTGDYVSLYQSNIYRKIVATEPGLTTIGSAEVIARANGYKMDSYAAYGQQIMYDIVNKPDGLRIGDQIEMSHYDRYSNLGFRTGEHWTDLKTVAPTRIWSARPEGIIGKVISKEMDSYFGPYGTVVQNPYRNNVYTIAVAPGTQVRGFTGGARAFIEFMDHDADKNSVAANRARDISKNGSTWSFDSRRSKENAMTVTSTKIVLIDGIAQQVTTETQYVDVVDDVDFIYYKYVGMNRRGLTWLAGLDEEVDLGDVKVYAPSMTAEAATVTATTQAARNNVVTAPPMRATAAIITPANFPASDVEILPLPMEALAQFSGVNMTVVAPPMTGTVGGGSPIVNTSGDRIRVFIDSDRTVRLFLKEDEY